MLEGRLFLPPAREAVGGPFATRPAHYPHRVCEISVEPCGGATTSRRISRTPGRAVTTEPGLSVRIEGTTPQPRSCPQDICWALRHGHRCERGEGRRPRWDA
jgi:hypothetical protein